MSAEAYSERGEREESGAIYLLTSNSPPVTSLKNLNNFKQASLGNHWFTKQTGSTSASLLVKTGPCVTTAMQFFSCTGGLHFDWKWVLGRQYGPTRGALKHE